MTIVYIGRGLGQALSVSALWTFEFTSLFDVGSVLYTEGLLAASCC